MASRARHRLSAHTHGTTAGSDQGNAKAAQHSRADRNARPTPAKLAAHEVPDITVRDEMQLGLNEIRFPNETCLQ
jgi:hypothetical protein